MYILSPVREFQCLTDGVHSQMASVCAYFHVQENPKWQMALIVVRYLCVHTFTLGLTYEFERPFSTRDVLDAYFLCTKLIMWLWLCQLNLSPEAVIICWFVRVCVLIRGDVLDEFCMHVWQVVYNRWHWKCNPIMCFNKCLFPFLACFDLALGLYPVWITERRFALVWRRWIMPT